MSLQCCCLSLKGHGNWESSTEAGIGQTSGSSSHRANRSPGGVSLALVSRKIMAEIDSPSYMAYAGIRRRR